MCSSQHFWLDMRHKFVPLPQPLPNGAWGGCESCGALNNAGAPGCIADEAPAPGYYLHPVNFIENFSCMCSISVFYFAFDEFNLMR